MVVMDISLMFQVPFKIYYYGKKDYKLEDKGNE